MPPSKRPVHFTIRRVQYGTLQALIHKPTETAVTVNLYSTLEALSEQEDCLRRYLSESVVSLLVHQDDLSHAQEYAHLLIRDGTIRQKRLECS